MNRVLLFWVTTMWLLLISHVQYGQSPNLGSTSSFSLFTAAGAFNNLGVTLITGDIGTNVGAFSGFPPGVVIGQIHVADAVSAQAAADVVIAYSDLAGLTCGSVIGTTLGNGQILTPDIYCTGAATTLNGSLVLDAQGDPNAVFIFQIDGAFATSTFSSITLLNGAALCNVYWQVNGAFFLGDFSVFYGTVIAGGAISLSTGATLYGRGLTTAGAIETSANVVSYNGCGSGILPVISCPADISVSCTAEIPPPDTNAVVVTDVCNAGTTRIFLADVISGQTCAQQYMVTRTYQVTNACGETAVCAQTITVNDQTAPVITCPATVSVSCDGALPPPAPASVTATDNCGGLVTVTFSGDVISNVVCPGQYTVVRTYTASDACGNAAFCEQSLTINDQTAPVITCPATVSVSCDGALPAPAPAGVTATDNCGGLVTVTFSGDVISNVVCVSQYTVIRTYTASDECGNDAFCEQTITVNDQTAPVITCPATVSLSCDGPLPAPAPASVTATDNCGGLVTVTFSGDVISNVICAGQYTVIRTYTASDECGNSSFCEQTITVNDQTAPVITCPTTVLLSCDGALPAPAPAGVTATDNCGGLVTVTFSGDVISNVVCAGQYTVIRTYTASDECGNSAFCEQTISVNDQTAPLITCPANVSVSCDGPLLTPNPASVVATDNCGGLVTVTFSGDVISNVVCAGQYTVIRTYTASDDCGNTAVCAQTLIVNDQIAPVISCPATVLVSCEDVLPAPAPASITATDNCGGLVTVTFIGDVISNVICPGQYTITRTYAASDDCGNDAFCDQTITVGNALPPSIICPPNVQVACIDEVPAIAPGAVIATSSCGGVLTVNWMGDVISNQICVNQLTISRTYRAVDLCGNEAVCVQTISVFDQIAPVFVNPPVPATIDCSQPVPALVLPVATDNCSGVTVTYLGEQQLPAVCPLVFNVIRTWVATDLCGNSTELEQAITVTDTVAPQFTNAGPFDVLLECELDTNPDDYQNWLDNHGGATVTDCSTVTWSYAPAPFQWNPSPCGGAFQEYVRFTATDACGNINFRDAVFTTVDLTPPEFTVLPQDITVECGEAPDAAGETKLWDWYKSFGFAEVSDNCGSVKTEIFLLSEIPGCGYTYSLTYEFRATDECGNTNFVSATFTLEDHTPPVIDHCPENNVVFSCVDDIPFPDTAGFIAHDLCGEVFLTVTSKTTGAGCAQWPLVTEYTYTATDECGNVSTCYQYFQVIDTFPIIYAGPDTITIACINDLPGPDDIIALLTPFSYDNCFGFVCLGLVSTTYDSNAVTFTLMAKDVCDNMTLPFVVTYIATGACKPLCSAPQAIWGEPAADINGTTTTTALEQFMGDFGCVIVGQLNKTIVLKSADCIQSILPGAGTVAQLRLGNYVFSTENGCLSPSQLLNADGTLKNKLAANTMTLQFNIWYNEVYNSRNLGIQRLSGLPVCLIDPIVLEKMGAGPLTVQGLLDLSNDYLAGVGFFPVGFGALLNDAVEQLNSYWQNCQLNDPCSSQERSVTTSVLSGMQLSPNPVLETVLLQFTSTVDATTVIRFMGANGEQSQSVVQVVKGINTIRLSTQHLPAGVYTVVVQQDQTRETIRMVKVAE